MCKSYVILGILFGVITSVNNFLMTVIYVWYYNDVVVVAVVVTVIYISTNYVIVVCLFAAFGEQQRPSQLTDASNQWHTRVRMRSPTARGCGGRGGGGPPGLDSRDVAETKAPFWSAARDKKIIGARAAGGRGGAETETERVRGGEREAALVFHDSQEERRAHLSTCPCLCEPSPGSAPLSSSLTLLATPSLCFPGQREPRLQQHFAPPPPPPALPPSFPPLPHLGEFRSRTFRHSHAGAKASRSESHGQRRRVASKLALTVVEVVVKVRKWGRGEEGEGKREEGRGARRGGKRNRMGMDFSTLRSVITRFVSSCISVL